MRRVEAWADHSPSAISTFRGPSMRLPLKDALPESPPWSRHRKMDGQEANTAEAPGGLPEASAG